MKRTIGLVLLILCIMPIAMAESPKNQNIVIDINDDGSATWQVELSYENYTENSDFFVLSYIKSVEVLGENGTLDCNVVDQGVGTLITCNKINEKKVHYTFTAYNLVRNVQSAKMFSYPFLITGFLDEFNLTINLPLGAGIVDSTNIGVNGLSPFMPDTGIEGSDGRKIFIKWFFVKPALGQTIEVYSLYEQIFGPELMIIGVVLIALLIPVIIFIFFFRRRSNIEQVLPVLNEGERSIMKVVMEAGGEVDQRKIVKECDMSKSKISRIVKDLEERGLISVTKRGRSNKIKLAFSRNSQKKNDEKRPEKKEEKTQKSSDKNPGKNPFYQP